MLDSSLVFLLQNIFLVILLFWLLSVLGVKFFKKKNYRNSNELFECGFLATHKLNLNFNLNFIIIVTLLIIYDVEFFFIVPLLFNVHLLGGHIVVVASTFIGLIMLSFIYDWEMVLIYWNN